MDKVSETPTGTRGAAAVADQGEAGVPMKLAYSVTEAGEMIGVCRRTVYELLNSGQLRSVKLGRRRLVRHEDLAAFVAALDEAA